MWLTDWAPSTTAQRPVTMRDRDDSFTGTTVPSARLRARVTETSLVLGVMSRWYSSRITCPSLSTGDDMIFAPFPGAKAWLPGNDVGVMLEMGRR